MKSLYLSRRDAVFGFISFGAVATGTADASTSAGMVRALNGQARARQRAQERALSQDDNIFVGDRILTGEGARANLLLGAATDLRMGANSQIQIDRFLVHAGGVITLENGAIAIDKDPGSRSGTLTVRSPYGLIAVRGTRFFAGPSNGVFGVFVENGSVAVTGGGRRVIVNAGHGTDIAAPGSAPTEPRIWGWPRIQRAWAAVH